MLRAGGTCRLTSAFFMAHGVDGYTCLLLDRVMRRLTIIKIKPALLAWLLSFTATTFPQANGTPAARKEFDSGETARKAGDFAAAAAATAYRKAIELDPDFTKAHEQYIFTLELNTTRALGQEESQKAKTGDENAEAGQSKRIAEAATKVRESLSERYEQWAKEYPDKPVYEWALGYINMENDPQAAEAYFEAALKINTRFARAHSDLAIIERDRGGLEVALQDARQATENDPSDPEYLFNYAYLMKDSNCRVPKYVVGSSAEISGR